MLFILYLNIWGRFEFGSHCSSNQTKPEFDWALAKTALSKTRLTKYLATNLKNLALAKWPFRPPLFARQFWFLYEHLLLFFVACEEWKLCKWRWAPWRKHVDIFHPCYPLNTHTHADTHSIHEALSWPSLVALSLLAVSQADFNNWSHITFASSFLLTISGHFSPTRQVQRQEGRILSTTLTNNTGLSNWRRKTIKKGKVVCLDLPLHMLEILNTQTHDELHFLTSNTQETLKLGRCSWNVFDAIQFHQSEGN